MNSSINTRRSTLADQHSPLDGRGGLPCLVNVERCQQLCDGIEVLCDIFIARVVYVVVGLYLIADAVRGPANS
jgi:hypothetical protein